MKTQRSAVILDLCLRKTREGKYHDHRNLIVFEKVLFQNFFCMSTLKRRARVFKFFRFENRFRKAPFSWRTSVDGTPKGEIKLRFQIPPV